MSLIQRFFQFREQANPDAAKPFLDHLEDLRWTLIKMGVALVCAMVVAFSFSVKLVAIVQEPLRQIDPKFVTELKVFGVVDPFVISLQLSFYAGLVLAFPFLLYFLAQFVVPALTLKERRSVFPAIAVGFGLFLIGVYTAYRWILPQTLGFFFKYAKTYGWQPYWTVRDYFSFVTHLVISIGLAFEMPVVVLLLVKLNFLTFDIMRRTRTFAIPIIFVLAAIIAPSPDPMTLFALGLPMCLLYEACIWMAWFVERGKKKAALAIEAPGQSTPSDGDSKDG
jgi:sec-independent protein translocase protein TatC